MPALTRGKLVSLSVDRRPVALSGVSACRESCDSPLAESNGQSLHAS